MGGTWGIVYIGLLGSFSRDYFWLTWGIIMGQSLVLEILEDDAVNLSFGSVVGKTLQSLE